MRYSPLPALDTGLRMPLLALRGDLFKSQVRDDPMLAMLRFDLSGLLPEAVSIGRLEFLRSRLVGLPGTAPEAEAGLVMSKSSSSEPAMAVVPVTLLMVRVRTELVSSSKSSSSPDDAPKPRRGTL